MKRSLPLILIFLVSIVSARAGRVSGSIKDQQAHPLAFASISVKGSNHGTTANNEGQYFLDLVPGTYTIIARYVGYELQQQTITVGKENMVVDFALQPQQLTLDNVTVKSNGEDPAYAIIRKAIKKRETYRQPLDSFTCEAYIKTLIKTRKLPHKILGQKIDEKDWKEMGVDSSGKGIIYLSESLTKIAFKKPDETKLEVISGRESGSNGYGFNFPVFINFYENNVNILTTQFAPRGFVSPIADGALNYYRYHYLGAFFEEGKMINKIQVTPKRNFEPLFSGTINITEDDWRIHSLDLLLTKESQLELLDTMHITQMQSQVAPGVWRTKDQVIYFTFKMFGIDATGVFLNVYNKYDVTPSFRKKYFNNIAVKYDTAVNRRSHAYWDSVRPVPLEPEELHDYSTKDSLYKDDRDSMFYKTRMDSLRRAQKPVTVGGILWNGFERSDFNPEKRTTFTWKPLLKGTQYNTVEGVEFNADASLERSFPQLRQRIRFSPHLQYGLSNGHFNASGLLEFRKRSFDASEEDPTTGRSVITLAGGKRTSQLNRESPIRPFSNSVNTLLFNRNYMKIDENWFTEFNYRRQMDNGLRYQLGVLYEDRLPLENTTDFSIIHYGTQKFTPNYPVEKLADQFSRHQAVIASASVRYQPGQKYIQFPRNKVPLGSKYPVLELGYTKGFRKIAGSDVDFDKWRFDISDDMNLKLGGLFQYRVGIGGFLNSNAVYIQDYQHFNGNRLVVFTGDYMNSFLAAPYYANSTTASFYTTLHVAHHFNGLLTNKIPLFKKLNWHLVAGSNAFYVNSNNNYLELYGGMENIFKIFRVDLVSSWLNNGQPQYTIRVGLGGLLGSAFRFD